MQPTDHESYPTPTPSVASEIPLDVLEVIFKSLNPTDLSTCCRVNKAVHSLAIEALYRDLRPNRRNVMQVCLKLCNNPNLASRVRSFIICDRTVDMYLGIIQDTLTLLPRLHTLCLFTGQSGSWILPLPDACPFQLTTFSCAFFYDAHLSSFLDGQHDLKYLAVSGPNPLGLLRAISPRLVPNLVSIHAPLSLIEALVPGRPIRDVTTFHTPDSSLSVSCLSQSTAVSGVQRFMVNFGYLQAVGCEQLAQCIPKLLYLSIDADKVEPDDEEMLDELTEWIEEYLSYAKHLDCLTIRFYPSHSTIPCQELDFSDMVTSTFAASEKLRHVIITFFGLKAKYVCRQEPGHDWYIVNT